jgi:CheY-like chemotaxis protein
MAKILLVEDDNNLREIYEARLQAEGYDIVSAADGESALAVAKQEKPDLVISDVMMPRISGFEMLDILRNTEGLKSVKVIMLTALGQAEDKSRADKLGADRYLVKSQVTLEDIVKSAGDLLGLNQPETAAPVPEMAATPAAVVPVAPAPAPMPIAPAPTAPAADPAQPVVPAPSAPAPAPMVTPPTPVVPAPEPAAPVAPQPVAPEPAAPAPQPVTPPPAAQPAPVIPAPVAAVPAPQPTPAEPVAAPDVTPAPAPAMPAPAEMPAPATPADPTAIAQEEATAEASAQTTADSEKMMANAVQDLLTSTEGQQPAANVAPGAPEAVPLPTQSAEGTDPAAATPAAAPTDVTPAPDQPAEATAEPAPEAPANPAEVPAAPSAMPSPEPATDTAPQQDVAPAPEITTPETAPLEPVPVPEPAPESSSDTDSGGSKKVIRPLAPAAGQPSAPDLNELLAKEGITDMGKDQPASNGFVSENGPTNAALPHPPGHVISPNPTGPDGKPVDPNSIAL